MTTMTQPELKVGEMAPDFTLPGTSGEKVTLSSFRGKNHVLLAFFPLAFTPVCTSEFCSFWEDHSRFEENGTKVFGLSVDHTASQKAFQEKAAFKTDLLSDFRHYVARSFVVLLEETFFTRRAYFLVDKQGQLAWQWIEAQLGHRRENDELLDQIRKLP